MSERDQQLDEIFDMIDELMIIGRFDVIDFILKYLDLRITIDQLLGFLTITLPAKSKLTNRKRMLEYVGNIYGYELIRGLV